MKKSIFLMTMLNIWNNFCTFASENLKSTIFNRWYTLWKNKKISPCWTALWTI